MKIIEDGPDIPDELLEARDYGNVVFFCGAGVSRPSGFPDFVELTRSVVSKLDPTKTSDAYLLFNQFHAPSTPLSDGQTVLSQLDRVFKLLESKYDRFQIENSVSNLLRTPRNADVRSHTIIKRLSKSADGKSRVVTTNFDTLFEKGDRSISKHIPPHLPNIQGNKTFEGIAYLHGRIAKNSVADRNLVLSTADYGRAYLAEGWATQFVKDLLNKYILVFLGYSADDPPITYLLEGLNVDSRQIQTKMYAFASKGDPSAERSWISKGVQPILFSLTPDDRFSNLWTSLEAWADRSDNPQQWNSYILELAQQKPQTLKPFERAQVLSHISSDEGSRNFSKATPAPPADWLFVLDPSIRNLDPTKLPSYVRNSLNFQENFGIDEDQHHFSSKDLPTEGNRQSKSLISQKLTHPISAYIAGTQHFHTIPLTPTLDNICSWISKVMHEPNALWWLAGYSNIHPRLLWHLQKRFYNRDSKIPELLEKYWSLAFEVLPCPSENFEDYNWYEFQNRLKAHGWTNNILRQYESASRPRLTLERNEYDLSHLTPGFTGEKSEDIVNFNIKFPPIESEKNQIPKTVLNRVFTILTQNLDRASEYKSLLKWNRQLNVSLTAYENSEYKEVLSKEEKYLLKAGATFERIAEKEPLFAKYHGQNWLRTHSDYSIKLRIFAWRFRSVYSGKFVCDDFLSLKDGDLWGGSNKRDILHSLLARWCDFKPTHLNKIETRLRKGPSRWTKEDSDKYKNRKNRSIAAILGWLTHNDCGLSSESNELLSRLRKDIPDWRKHYEFSIDKPNTARSGFVKTEKDPSQIENLPIKSIVPKALEIGGRKRTFTEFAPFQGLVKSYPRRALLALLTHTKSKGFVEGAWCELLREWPDDASYRLTRVLAFRLSRLSEEQIFKLGTDVTYWLKTNLPNIFSRNEKEAFSIWDCIVKKTANYEVGSSDEYDSNSLRLEESQRYVTYGDAINSTAGHLAEILFALLSSKKRREASRIPKKFKTRIGTLISGPDRISHNAISEASIRMTWLYFLDPKWTLSTLAPFLDIENSFSRTAWNAYLFTSYLPQKGLFNAIKKYYFHAFEKLSSWESENELSEKIIEHFVLLTIRNENRKQYIRYQRAEELIRLVNDNVRAHAIWHLTRLPKNEYQWRSQIKSFIQKVLPKEKSFKSPNVTAALVNLAEDFVEEFEDVINTITPYLSHTKNLNSLDLSHTTKDELTLSEKHPSSVLKLLDTVVSDVIYDRPWNLKDSLDLIAKSKPSLRNDSRWLRLYSIATRPLL